MDLLERLHVTRAIICPLRVCYSNRMLAWVLFPVVTSTGGVLELVSQNETKIIFRNDGASCTLTHEAGELVSSCPIKSSGGARAEILAMLADYHMSVSKCTQDGKYWSATLGQCADCHSSCKACLGPSDADCLQCYDNRGATVSAGRCDSPPPPPPALPPAVPPPSPPALPPALESCHAYKKADSTAASGEYSIKLPNGAVTVVLCYMTNDYGYTRLVGPGSPAYSDSGWLSTSEDSSFSTGTFTAAWLHMTSFTHLAFMHFDSDKDLSSPSSTPLEYDTSTCRDSSTSASAMLRQASVGTKCGSLTLAAAYTHSGCALKARFSYKVHTWDGGVSASLPGWGSNGYKTNNNVNCNSQCVINCVKNDGKQAGQSDDSIWVR